MVGPPSHGALSRHYERREDIGARDVKDPSRTWRRFAATTGSSPARTWFRSLLCASVTCSRPSCGRDCSTFSPARRGSPPYFDLSFQHSSEPILRRMRRFGSTERFLELLDRIRVRCPEAGVRSNFIVGFPGESDDDLAELELFLGAARLDAIGVFGYSDEDGTEAAGFDGKIGAEAIRARVKRVSDLAEQLTAQRAEDRVGEIVDVLIENIGADGPEGRAAHQASEVDGITTLSAGAARPGEFVTARVVGSYGVDLLAEAGVAQ